MLGQKTGVVNEAKSGTAGEKIVAGEDLLRGVFKPSAWIFIHSAGMNLAEAALLHGHIKYTLNWILHFSVGSSIWSLMVIEKLGCVVKCSALYLRQFAEQIALL